MTAVSPPPTAGASPRRNRNDVVHAAGRLFAERGFHGTSMRDLGEAMGLLGSSLYAHIGSKNELLVEVIASGAERFSALAHTVISSGATPAEGLRQLVAGHVRILTENADHAATFLNEARHLEPDQRAQVLAWRDSYEAAYRATLARGVASGDFRPDLDPARTATFVLSLLNGVQRWYRPDGPDSADTIVAQLHHFIERAVAAPEDARAHL
ncbi:MAG: TetR/AcrR family transcriptional regulator [Acidimicrobiales bacterium]